MFQKIGFVGAGQMARAIGITLTRKGLVKPEDVFVGCPEEQFLQPWKDVGCRTTKDNGEVIEESQTIIWAVKPQVFSSAVRNSIYTGNSSKFHVSIMAGIPLEKFTETVQEQYANSKVSTARVMPNMAMKVGSGCSVYAMHQSATAKDKALLTNMLNAVGLSFEVPESQINAYCGLFGSGIGFMFPIMEALSDGAVQMGLPRDLSLKIAAQTMKGAAELILDNDHIHPAMLKDAVCSPGGTTIAGIAKLEKLGVRSALIEAIAAATSRGEELGKKNNA